MKKLLKQLVDSGLATRMRLDVIESEIRAKVAKYDMSVDEMYLLLTIYNYEYPPTPRELSEEFEQHLRTTNFLLRKLSKKGMLTVTQDKIDYHIHISDEGRNLLEQLC